MADNETSDMDYSKFVAVTQIRHGEEDGTVTVVEPGENVSNWDQKLLDEWWASGSIAPGVENTEAVMDENERLKLRVAELTAQLESARQPANLYAEPGSGAQVLAKNEQRAADGEVMAPALMNAGGTTSDTESQNATGAGSNSETATE